MELNQHNGSQSPVRYPLRNEPMNASVAFYWVFRLFYNRRTMRRCMLPYSEASTFGLFRLPAKKVGADAVGTSADSVKWPSIGISQNGENSGNRTHIEKSRISCVSFTPYSHRCGFSLVVNVISYHIYPKFIHKYSTFIYFEKYPVDIHEHIGV